MNITLVKKIKADGNLCRKSAEVFEKLNDLKLLGQIDKIIFANEKKPLGEGMSLALKYRVKAAPFFIVERDNEHTKIYTSYYILFKEVLKYQVSENEELSEIMAQNPNLDFL
jgi:hypothetical protein